MWGRVTLLLGALCLMFGAWLVLLEMDTAQLQTRIEAQNAAHDDLVAKIMYANGMHVSNPM